MFIILTIRFNNSVILLLQNMFPKGKYNTSISRNAWQLKNRITFCRHKKYCGTNIRVPCLHCDKTFSRKDKMTAQHVKEPQRMMKRNRSTLWVLKRKNQSRWVGETHLKDNNNNNNNLPIYIARIYMCWSIALYNHICLKENENTLPWE